MTYNVFGGTLNLALSIYPPLRSALLCSAPPDFRFAAPCSVSRSTLHVARALVLSRKFVLSVITH